jgi:site-specific recombinase XerD
MHVLFALTPSGVPTPFAPLVQFFRDAGPRVRLAWQRETAWAVGLLLDFLVVYESDVAHVPTDTLFAFAHALRSGTTPGSRLDRAGLVWPERSHARSSRCLALVTKFLDWLSNRTGRVSPNAWRQASSAERLVLARRVERRSTNALLGHVARRIAADTERVRTVEIRPKRAPTESTVYAFDEKDFERLMERGFARRTAQGAALHRRLRLRDAMITLLLHYGGLRVSEPFHLFVGDVDVDPDQPDSARVRLYHPEDGAAPKEGERRWRDRAHYLHERWNLMPRSRAHGSYHAGWKDLSFSDQRRRFAQAFWFPSQAGRLFLALHHAYLEIRPTANHPFLFVSERAASRGNPYTIAAFKQAHARAVRRIGLVPAKERGTTPHAHRHSYGRALADAGLDRLVIQRALHHRSPGSQDVYTLADNAPANAAISQASRRIWGDRPVILPSLERVDD